MFNVIVKKNIEKRLPEVGSLNLLKRDDKVLYFPGIATVE